MAGEFGLSFAPTAQNQAEQAKQGQTPIQDAIKVLSLRIPQFVGAQGIAPGALMGGPGSGGVPGASAPGGIPGGLDDFLRRLFGGGGGMPGGPGPMGPQGPQTGPSMPPPMSAPMPNVRPGEDQRFPAPVASGPEPPLIGGITQPGSFSPEGASPSPLGGVGRRPPMQRMI